ncbi:CHAT domain-containing protein [Planktothricoides raciborskii]|uniref:CHAT domain-containing protein n=1 Tax=Planktothricoides raciborskii TaxID=132608 RepID=UPI001686E4EE|nr:CHAT domain-containing tetratricopeptide repeat protein [Planktothricoides raciborskii]MBD2585490.1 CHAT domain-containing protein [Planktothricoides raciborskii FACHB-1261]
MDEQRLNAYIQLIQAILGCASGEEMDILQANPELVDAGLVQVMRAEAEIKMELGELKAADRLLNVGIKIVTANYSLPTLRKAEADALLQQGFQQYQHSEYPQAWESLQQSLALYQAIGDKANIALCWGQLGSVQRNRGNWDEAERLYQQCLAIETELGDRKGMATSWGQLGDIQRFRGNWDEAERLYQQSLALRTELGDRSGMASSWELLGYIQNVRGNWDEAERLYQQCLAIETELGDRSGMATSWGVLGDIQRNRGNWDEAERLYQQSLALSTELGDRSGMAAVWGVLGDIQRNRGNWDEAERLYQQSLALRTELGDRAGMATSWGQLGYIQRNRGNWDEAERLYQQYLALSTELGDRSGMATSWGVLGDIQRNRGNWDEAERLYQQSLALRTELGDRSGMAAVWGVLGDIQRNRGNWDEAERLYQQSLALRTELGDRSGMAAVWGVLGDIQRFRGNWDEAERLYQQCLALRTELGDRAGMASSWGLLGDIQRFRGNWDEAERLYQQSLALRTELGDKSGMGYVYNVLAFVHQHSNKIPEAFAAWRAGLAACPPNRFPVEALLLGSNLGDAAFDIKDWQTAIEGYEAAITAVETSCTFAASNQEKQKRRTAQIGVYEKLVQACINSGDIGRALASVERSKSRNLIELLANRDIYPKGDIPPEILTQLDTLRREVTAKQQLLETLDRPTTTNSPSDTLGGDSRGSSSGGLTPDAIETIRQEYQKAEQKLNKLLDIIKTYDPTFSLTQRVEPIKFSEIQGLLDEHTALIEWYCTRERIYAFVVLGGVKERNFLLKNIKMLLFKLSTLFNFPQKEDSEPPFLRGAGGISVWISTPEAYTQLQELRQTYLDTYSQKKSDWEEQFNHYLHRLADILHISELIAPLTDKYRQLILVPYRDLHLFPLHILPLDNSSNPPYLMDKFADGVKYAPSCQFLQEISRRNRKDISNNTSPRFFAIQNPTEDLEYADLEVQAISPAFQPHARILPKKAASKAALKETATAQDFQGAEYIHFAGHGAFNFVSPLLSPLVLAGAVVKREDGQTESLPRENHPEPKPEPELTGNSRYIPWRKGKTLDLTLCYTLGELFQLDLPSCRLVILSACETGLVDFSPELEEYISLGLGFLYAGAPNVICSLWAVNDLSTAILMVKLYEEMQIQPSITLALKAAQQWMRTVTKQELINWLNPSESQENAPIKQKLRENVHLGFKPSHYQPYQHPKHWGAFCAIGV